jgi:hypothetical protein
MFCTKSAAGASVAILALFAAVIPAQAGPLALTADGVSRGFTLTTFVDGYNFGNYGPLAQAILPNGKVITGSVGDRKIYIFNDVDNQHLSDAEAAIPYSCETSNCNFAMTTAGGEAYGAQLFGGRYYHFDSTGARTLLPGDAGGLFNYLGMWFNPVNGHIIAASYSGLVDINPLTGSVRVINAGVFPDGVSVSGDGQTIYVEVGATVRSYAMNDGHLIHTYVTGHGPDGTGVIRGGLYDGLVVVNNNDGTVGLLDPSKPDGDPNQFVIIASGGTRGDFTSADTRNGTLFMSQVNEVVRLGCGPGCTIGGGTATPEPASMGLIGAGLLAVGFLRRKRG